MFKNRKIKVGKVTSCKMDKTVVVAVERLVKHPKYKKYYKTISKFMADDRNNSCSVGDVVEIIESRPLSKNKHWKVKNIVKKKEKEEVILNDTTTDASESC